MVVGIIIIAIVVIIVLWIISTYNSLVGLRNKVGDQWAQIDTVLKRRFDLIPNLVATVKGYAKHEEKVFTEVTEARSNYEKATSPKDKIEANNKLNQALTSFLAVAENYPELKANENFLSLQGELKETEDKIQYARQFYNDVVLKYNNKIEMVPSNIVASIFHFTKADFFKAAEQERENVKVDFEN